MSYTSVRTRLPLFACLLLACLVAMPALGVVPVTANDQAEWLGDVYATGLQELYGASIAPAAAIGRTELVGGLRQALQRPLTTRELTDFQAVLFDDGGPLVGWDLPPVEMGLRRDACSVSAWLRDYLARPLLTDEQDTALDRQLAELAEALRVGLTAELSGEFADKPAEEAAVAEDVSTLFSRRVTQLALIHMGPYFKRPFSPEEMASLRTAVSQVPAEARRLWERAKPMLAGPDSLQTLTPRDLLVATGRPVVSFTNATMGMQYAAPSLLSPEEERVWHEERQARTVGTGGGPR